MGKLKDYCRQFIEQQEIGCAEDIYQSNHVIRNAYEFIEGVCDIVGYAKEENDNEAS